MVRNPPETQEKQEMSVRFLDLEDPLEKEMATHSNILVWEATVNRFRKSRTGLKQLNRHAQ